MADILNQFVKFDVHGGNALGKVVLVHAEKFDFEGKTIQATKELPHAIVETASGQRVTKAVSDLTILSNEQYIKEITDIVDNLCQKANIATISTLQANITKIESERDDFKNKVTVLSNEKEEINTELAKCKTDKAKMKEEMDKMCEEKKGSARFEELKTLEANDGISSNKDEAVAKLGKMSDEAFAQIKQLATKAYQKLTEIRQSNKPATTDSSLTDKTKLTEASDKSPDNVIEAAVIEDDKSHEIASAANHKNETALAEFVGEILTRNKNKKVKTQ